jgi:hypothetical protein
MRRCRAMERTPRVASPARCSGAPAQCHLLLLRGRPRHGSSCGRPQQPRPCGVRQDVAPAGPGDHRHAARGPPAPVRRLTLLSTLSRRQRAAGRRRAVAGLRRQKRLQGEAAARVGHGPASRSSPHACDSPHSHAAPCPAAAPAPAALLRPPLTLPAAAPAPAPPPPRPSPARRTGRSGRLQHTPAGPRARRPPPAPPAAHEAPCACTGWRGSGRTRAAAPSCRRGRRGVQGGLAAAPPNALRSHRPARPLPAPCPVRLPSPHPPRPPPAGPGTVVRLHRHRRRRAAADAGGLQAGGVGEQRSEEAAAARWLLGGRWPGPSLGRPTPAAWSRASCRACLAGRLLQRRGGRMGGGDGVWGRASSTPPLSPTLSPPSPHPQPAPPPTCAASTQAMKSELESDSTTASAAPPRDTGAPGGTCEDRAGPVGGQVRGRGTRGWYGEGPAYRVWEVPWGEPAARAL